MKHIKAFADKISFIDKPINDEIYVSSEFMFKLASIYNIRIVYILFEVYKKKSTLNELAASLDLSMDAVSKICYSHPELFKYENGYWKSNIDDLMSQYCSTNIQRV